MEKFSRSLALDPHFINITIMRPIGLLERQKKKEASSVYKDGEKTKRVTLESHNYLERRIKELEEAGDSDTSSGSDSDSNEGDSESAYKKEGEGGYDNLVLSSVSVKDRIPKLPAALLPKVQCGKRTFKAAQEGNFPDERGDSSSLQKKSKKSVGFSDRDSSSDGRGDSERRTGGGRALERQVKEILADIKTTSAERRPNWCRVCSFQGKDFAELEGHRETELHKLAVKKEREMSYCNLCKKQFTSIDQLKSHNEGKWHKERLAARASYRGRAKFY